MNNIKISLLTAPIALAFAVAQAHHSGAMFDSTKTQTITGKVTEFNWVNPHSSFKVEVTDASGKSEIWAIEMNTPQNLVATGWKRTSMKAGDTITAVVRPLRNGKPGGSYISVKLADGKVLDGSGPGDNLGNTAPAAP